MTNAREVLTSSVTVEWFTPEKFVNSSRNVMGSIDLDPASCASANEVIRATAYFDKASDGLKQPWNGNVFLNPPYGRGGQSDWTKKLIKEYENQNITSAICLVNSATGNKWFQPLWQYPICFPTGRIKFISPVEGTKVKHSPTHSNAFVYLGEDVDAFINEFKQYGPIMVQANT